MCAKAAGIPLKKKFGQHFLRDKSVVESMLDHVCLSDTSSVFEIGCGDGFLTRSILTRDIARLWVFEIDIDWVNYIKKEIADSRLTIFHENFLDVDFDRFKTDAPWIILSNLPYQITFPVLRRLQEHRALLSEGILMIQEEVAQKLVATKGRGYGYPSLFFQYFFEITLLQKIPPSAFYPPPKVYSRLVHLKPRTQLQPIVDENNFWKFVKVLFKQPRRTLKNNFAQTHYDIGAIPASTLALRAQQLSFNDIVHLWDNIRD